MWAFFVVLQEQYNCDMKGHWRQITTINLIVKKVWTIVRISKMWHRDRKRANSVENNCADKLAWSRVVTNLFFFKKYLQITVKQSALKQSMSVFRFSISSWLSLGRLPVSSNLSIFPWLPSLSVYNCSILTWFFVFIRYQ